jgi:hypothetical protein
MIEIVHGVLEAFPATHDAPGPPKIPLVEHARAGGADAQPALELLESFEVAR